jgi:hypothetical protein
MLSKRVPSYVTDVNTWNQNDTCHPQALFGQVKDHQVGVLTSVTWLLQDQPVCFREVANS